MRVATYGVCRGPSKYYYGSRDKYIIIQSHCMPRMPHTAHGLLYTYLVLYHGRPAFALSARARVAQRASHTEPLRSYTRRPPSPKAPSPSADSHHIGGPDSAPLSVHTDHQSPACVQYYHNNISSNIILIELYLIIILFGRHFVSVIKFKQ